MHTILVFESEERSLLLLGGLLKAKGYSTVTTTDGEVALEAVRRGEIDAVLMELKTTQRGDDELFTQFHMLAPDVPVIALASKPSVEAAVSTLRQGFFDYLAKPLNVEDMLACLSRAVGARHAKKGLPLAEEQSGEEGYVAVSTQMRRIFKMVKDVGPSDVTVLVNGESGTGKEVVARAIHDASPRASRKWMAVNCAALPENLLESELFGHVRGAFTGAVADKKGLFEVADGGTLFLDEVSSMPLPLQSKLLRALQEREIRRVGDTRDIPVDVRVVAASNVDLGRAVVEGSFRNDLYYRLAVVTLDIPPLRERTDDILPLVRHFIVEESKRIDKKIPALSSEAATLLQSYRWPGNVRELVNAVKHALAFHRFGDVTPELLPPAVRDAAATEGDERGVRQFSGEAALSLKAYLRRKGKEYIEQVLAANGFNREKAAALLRVNPVTLYRRLKDEED